MYLLLEHTYQMIEVGGHGKHQLKKSKSSMWQNFFLKMIS